MSEKSNNHRSVLNDGQLAVLGLLYKYRFGNIELLTRSLGLKVGTGLYQKLSILLHSGFIDKHYDKSYRLRGMPAAYFLTPKGLKALQGRPGYQSIDDNLIQYSYREKTVSEPFILRNISLYKASLQLQQLYPTLKLFTKREIRGLSYFPKQLPDAFVTLKLSDNEKPLQFFLDIISDDTNRNVIDKKISDYTDFFESGGWDSTGRPLPNMLLVCQTGKFEKYLQRLVAKKRNSLNSDEPDYYTTTVPALDDATREGLEIWSDVEDPEDLLALQDL